MNDLDYLPGALGLVIGFVFLILVVCTGVYVRLGEILRRQPASQHVTVECHSHVHVEAEIEEDDDWTDPEGYHT